MKRWRYWFNLLVFCALTVIITLGLGVAYITRQGALKYVYPSRVAVVGAPTEPYQDITLTTADGLQLAAWYTPPQNGVIILAAHCYVCSRNATLHDLFVRNGYGVLSWDFRAHGNSAGNMSTLGYYEVRDVEAALAYALAQPRVQQVGAWGTSMGAVTLIQAAAQHPKIGAVVADSAFTAVADELEIIVRVDFLRPWIRFFAEQETGLNFDLVRPVDQIGKISPRPVLLIQGLADATIPLDSGQRLYDAAGEPRALWTEPNVVHTGMYGAFPAEYEKRVILFFNEALLAPSN